MIPPDFLGLEITMFPFKESAKHRPSPRGLNIITNWMSIRLCFVSLFNHRSKEASSSLHSLILTHPPLGHSHPPSSSRRLKIWRVWQYKSHQSLMQANHAKPRRTLLSLSIRVQLSLGGTKLRLSTQKLGDFEPKIPLRAFITLKTFATGLLNGAADVFPPKSPPFLFRLTSFLSLKV